MNNQENPQQSQNPYNVFYQCTLGNYAIDVHTRKAQHTSILAWIGRLAVISLVVRFVMHWVNFFEISNNVVIGIAIALLVLWRWLSVLRVRIVKKSAL